MDCVQEMRAARDLTASLLEIKHGSAVLAALRAWKCKDSVRHPAGGFRSIHRSNRIRQLLKSLVQLSVLFVWADLTYKS